MMLKKLICYSLIISSVLCAVTESALLEQPATKPVIALGGFYYSVSLTDHQGRYKLPFVFPDMVAAELLQNYNCLAVDRMRNMHTATETDIRAITSIEELRVPYENYATADYVIKASLAAKPGEDGFRGHVFINDLQTEEIIEVPCTAGSLPEFPGVVARTIAQTLLLQPVPGKQDHNPICSNLNYAVIPPLLFDTTITATQAVDVLEQVLLSDRHPLLERQQLQNVLDEHVLAALPSTTPSPFQIMHLLDADRILCLSAARWFDSTYLTLKLIDTHTSLILDAASSVCREPDVLNTIGKLAAALDYQRCAAAIPPPLHDARKREAQFLLSRKQDPKRTSRSRQDLSAHWVNSIAASETAAMLCHKDQPFIHTIATNLAIHMQGMLCDWFTDNLTFDHKTPQQKRAVSLICAILQNQPNAEDLLYCAEACAYINDQPQAQAFLEQATSHPQSPNPGRLLRTKAWLAYWDKDYQQAHKLLSEYRKTIGTENLNVNMLFGRVNMILARETEDNERLAHLQELLFDAYGAPPSHVLDEFLVLYRRKHGPLATLKIIDEHGEELRKGFQDRLTLLLNRTRCHLELKNYLLTSQLSLDLFDAACRLKFVYQKAWCADYYLERCATIRRQIPEEFAYPERQWKRAAEIRGLPENQYIYIIPLGDAHPHVIHSIIGQVKYFWGDQVKTAPALPLPEYLLDKKSPGRKDYRIDPVELMHYLSSHAKIPEDALFTAYVTREPLIFAKGAYIYCTVMKPSDIIGSLVDNPVVASYYASGADGKSRQAALRLGWRINSMMRSTYMKKKRLWDGDVWLPLCSNFPCIFGNEINSGDGSVFLPAMCEECQEDYLKADFDTIKQAPAYNLNPKLYPSK